MVAGEELLVFPSLQVEEHLQASTLSHTLNQGNGEEVRKILPAVLWEDMKRWREIHDG